MKSARTAAVEFSTSPSFGTGRVFAALAAGMQADPQAVGISGVSAGVCAFGSIVKCFQRALGYLGHVRPPPSLHGLLAEILPGDLRRPRRRHPRPRLPGDGVLAGDGSRRPGPRDDTDAVLTSSSGAGPVAVFLLGNIVAAAASSFGTLLVARVVTGAAAGAFFGVAVTVAASWGAPKISSRGTGSGSSGAACR